ncbi:helix-turn-helix domain-containing protein [Sphingomonas koreensis]|nr:helix-turn-helix transcriptional regulator [Sphingomonas koreensis]
MATLGHCIMRPDEPHSDPVDGRRPTDHAIERLSERQKDCLRLVARGYTSKEIGRQIGISPATVDNHVRAALDTLHVEGRAEAARMLVAAEASQPLTSQPQPLVQTTFDAAIDVVSGPSRRWWQKVVPPMGGSRNSLGVEAKLFAILWVAVLGFSSLMILTIGIAVLLWLLR